MHLPHDSTTPRYLSKKNENIFTTERHTRLFITVLFIVAKSVCNPNIHQQKNGKQIVVYSLCEVSRVISFIEKVEWWLPGDWG